MTFRLDELDAASLEYLRRAEKLTGRESLELPGVSVPGAGGWFNGPRSAWGLLLVLGVALVAGAVVLAVGAPDRPRAQLRTGSGFVATGLALGLLCLAAGIVRFRRVQPPGPLGNFVFADSARLWVVYGGTVSVCEFADDLSARATHYMQNGSYQHTELTLRSSAGGQTITLYHKARAERLLGFLNIMGNLRLMDSPMFRVLAAEGSARVGLIALRVLDNLPLDNVPDDHLTDPPRPHTDPDAGAKRRTWAGAFGRLAAAGAVGVGLFFGLAAAFDYLRESKLYAAAEAEPSPSTVAIEKYLAEYRDHPHAGTVRDRKDDHLYAVAEMNAAAQDSPAGLRRYLAAPENTRHRAEAVARIGTYYDRTVVELKKRAAENPGKIDRALMDPLTILIASLKGLDDPVVTVGFVSDLQADPKTDDEKEVEKFLYDMRMQQEPRLKDVAAKSGANTAILPYLQAFEPGQVEARERVIYERMADAVQKAIKADILTLRQATPGERAMIEVRYKVVPSGSLYTYTITEQPAFALAATKTVKGLLRGYALNWEIVIRPPRAADPLRYTVASKPLSSLNYDSAPGDPEWAPYAILLYSAFYDLSDRMIRAFALDPGPAPNAFTFSAAASTKAITPDPFDPFKFDPRNPAGLPLPGAKGVWKMDPKTGKAVFVKQE